MTLPHTPGPWRWFSNERTGSVYLATPDRGRLIVMDFAKETVLCEGGEGEYQVEAVVPRFAVDWKDREQGAPRERWGGIMRTALALGRGDHNGVFDLAAHHPDAALIAAAPDLYALAVQVVERLPFSTPEESDAWLHHHLAPLARAAIAKAEGKVQAHLEQEEEA